jgi:HTH-type transcriptional regulator, competence development regulator
LTKLLPPLHSVLLLRVIYAVRGIAQSTISNLELGNRPARLSTIRKLAEALGVEPKELMKEE